MDEFKDVFPRGEENTAYSKYFVGQSYLNVLSVEQVVIGNVTFEPGCRNNWHIHHAKSGGGQILLCTAGRGYYQERGKEPRELKPGDVVNIPAEVKHWHGAFPSSGYGRTASSSWGTGSPKAIPLRISTTRSPARTIRPPCSWTIQNSSTLWIPGPASKSPSATGR